MINKLLRAVLTIIGAILGFGISRVAIIVLEMEQILKNVKLTDFSEMVIQMVSMCVVAIIFFIFTPKLKKLGMNIAQKIELEVQNVPTNDILIGSVGLIVGLLIAYLISPLLKMIEIFHLGEVISALVYVFLAYLGVSIATKKRDDFNLSLPNMSKKGNQFKEKSKFKSGQDATSKVLDTSVIIDGRIADLAKTGFIEGTLVIPEFVLEELRHIADSSDGLKRNRGRRGLDILNKIQNELVMKVEITDQDFEDVGEVDIKLLKLAQHIGGKVVTNDYNLNKVAELHGVDVLNINELANALKPVVLPGEEMVLTIIKEGKENNQGIAYLDDGTMIVVENGRKYIGETMKVSVTSVLQTAAGRMIFAKPKEVIRK